MARFALATGVALLTAVVVAGCGADSGAGVEVPDDVSVAVGPREGGRVQIGAATLAVPSGALDDEVDIVVKARAAVASELPEEGEVEGLVYDFGPDGLSFEKSAELELPLPEGVEEGDNTQIAYLDKETQTWVGLPTLIAGGKAVAKIKHFTDYAMVSRLGQHCSVATCGGDLTGHWVLHSQDAAPCEFSEKPAAACVQDFKSRNKVTQATLTATSDSVNAALTIARNVSYSVPEACTEAALGAKALTNEDCTTSDPVTGTGPACVTEDGVCTCSLNDEEVELFLAGTAGGERDSTISLSWEDEEGTAHTDTLHYCRKGDFLSVYGETRGHTLAMRFVKSGSASDPAPGSKPGTVDDVAEWLIPFMPFGSGIAQFIYVGNQTGRDGELELTAYDGAGEKFGPVVLNVSAAAKAVSKIGPSVVNALADLGTGYSSERLTLKLASSVPIHVTAGYNSRGDRVLVRTVKTDAATTTRYFPHVQTGTGMTQWLYVYNPGSEDATITLELNGHDGVDTRSATVEATQDAAAGALRNLSSEFGRADLSAFQGHMKLTSTQPVIPFFGINRRGDRIATQGEAVGSGDRIFTFGVWNGTGINSFAYLLNTGDEAVTATLQFRSFDSGEIIDTSEMEGLTRTIAPGTSVKIDHAAAAELGTFRGTIRVALSGPEEPSVIAHYYYNVRGDRVYQEGIPVDALTPQVVVPFMPYGSGISQFMGIAPTEASDVTMSVLDYGGTVHSHTFKRAELGAWSAIRNEQVNSALEEIGVTDKRLWLKFDAGETPLVAGAGYNSRGDRVFVPSLPACPDGGCPSLSTTPVADAGMDRTVTVGSTVSLDGSGSRGGGDALGFAWTLTTKPSGSAAALSSATGMAPTFTADVFGTYVVSLVVSDGTSDSSAATVSILACSSCAMGQYAQTACSAAQDTVCATCESCGTGEYQSAACGASANTVCETCGACGTGEYQTAPCGASSDTACSACTTCAAGQYETGACGETTDTQCSTCSTCDQGFYQSAACGGQSDTQCSACTACSQGQYASAPCAGDSDTTCSACTVCATGEYQAEACGASTDTVCNACSACAAGQYETFACGGTTDTQCAACSTCGQGFYQSAACAGQTDTQCSACTTCSAGQYASAPCAGDSDTTCTTCTACAAGQYASAPCGDDSDTVCSACSSCGQGEYAAQACGATTDTVCATCTACETGFFASGGCTGESDTTCSTCSACPSGQYVSGACTAVSDTVCSPCTACGQGFVETAACTESQDTVCTPVCDGTNGTDCSCTGAADDSACAGGGVCQSGICTEAEEYACDTQPCSQDTDCPAEAFCDSDNTCSFNFDCTQTACHGNGFCDDGDTKYCYPPPQCSADHECPCGTVCDGLFCAPPGCDTYVDQINCEAFGCQWNGAACADPPPPECADQTSQQDCESLGTCFWNVDQCEDDTGGGGCEQYFDEIECESDFNCFWEPGFGCVGPF